MRAIMIGAGAVAIQQFHAVLLVFASILIYSSFQVLVGGDDDEDEDFSQNMVVKFSNKFIASTPQFDEDRFFTMVDGAKLATPMFLCMVAVELSDVIFAVDSIPAVFGVTEVSSILGGLIPVFMLSAATSNVLLSFRIHWLYLHQTCLPSWVYGACTPSFPRRHQSSSIRNLRSLLCWVSSDRKWLPNSLVIKYPPNCPWQLWQRFWEEASLPHCSTNKTNFYHPTKTIRPPTASSINKHIHT